ncbi:MAG: sulfite exporter TauE/SafE family protein [Rubrobacteraceae bacterium]|nr:sulfite exporter TauE/SafE family protein [Rubrobacteraceae bacterium]
MDGLVEMALFGLLVGFLVGLTGVGGGSLMSPFLLSVGVPAPTAIGTDLAYATITKLFGSAQHRRQRSVNLQVVAYLALGSVPAGLLGVYTVDRLERIYSARSVDGILGTAIAAVVILAGLSLIARHFIPEKPGRRGKIGGWDGQSPMSLRRKALTTALGAIGGYLVGLTSIGSGTMIAVILLLVYPLSSVEVVGTDVAHATILSFTVGLAHALSGNVSFEITGILLLGGIPGVLIGSRLARAVPGRPLRLLLAAMLIFVGVRMILSG